MSMPPTPPQYGPYGTPTPPPAPPKKKNPLLVGCFGCGGLLVAVVIVVALAGAIGGAGKNAATPPAAVPSSVAAAPSKASPTPVLTVKPHTVLTESGNGMKSTRTFTVVGDWDLYYAFDCSNFGGQGNFAVTDDAGGDVYVNELAARGRDVTHQHNGQGPMALDINSECAWKIKVVAYQ